MNQQEEKQLELFESVICGDLEVIRILLELDVEPNISIDGYTPLMLATANGDRESVSLLLTAGANPYSQTNKDLSALNVAKMHSHWDLFNLFLKYPIE